MKRKAKAKSSVSYKTILFTGLITIIGTVTAYYLTTGINKPRDAPKLGTIHADSSVNYIIQGNNNRTQINVPGAERYFYDQRAGVDADADGILKSAIGSENEKVYLCLSKSSVVYHKEGCNYLQRCARAVLDMTVYEAEEKYGRRRCKVCF